MNRVIIWIAIPFSALVLYDRYEPMKKYTSTSLFILAAILSFTSISYTQNRNFTVSLAIGVGNSGFSLEENEGDKFSFLIGRLFKKGRRV